MESLLTVEQYAQSVRLRLLPPHLLPRAACTVCTFVTQRLFCCTRHTLFVLSLQCIEIVCKFETGLHCQFVACSELQHAAQHADGVQHWLAIELSRNQLYCFGCRDVIYDSEFVRLFIL
jgi:hypothetical protein